MGMLMHHTWLEQQKADAKVKPIKEPVTEKEPEEEKPVKEPETVRKTGGRRKVSK